MLGYGKVSFFLSIQDQTLMMVKLLMCNNAIIKKVCERGGNMIQKRFNLWGVFTLLTVFVIMISGYQNCSKQKDQAGPPEDLWTSISWNELSGRWGQAVISFGGSPSNSMNKVEVGLSSSPPSDSLDDILDGLGLLVSDSRRYGVCDIFKIHSVDANESVHVIDCVDNQETFPGDYHIAVGCNKEGQTVFESMFLRTGESIPSGSPDHVSVTLDGTVYQDFYWLGQLEGFNVNGVHSDMSNSSHTPAVSAYLQSIESGSSFTFSIESGSTGTINFQSNDPAALTEWRSRCSQL